MFAERCNFQCLNWMFAGRLERKANKERRKIRSDDYRQMPNEARANGLRDVIAGSCCVVLHASLISRGKEN